MSGEWDTRDSEWGVEPEGFWLTTEVLAHLSCKRLFRACIWGRFLHFPLEGNSRICLATHRHPIIHGPVVGTPICVHVDTYVHMYVDTYVHAHTHAVTLQWKAAGVHGTPPAPGGVLKTFSSSRKNWFRGKTLSCQHFRET